MATIQPIFNEFIPAKQITFERMIKDGNVVHIYIAKPLSENPTEPYESRNYLPPLDILDELQVFYTTYDDGIKGHSPIRRGKEFRVDEELMYFKKNSKEEMYQYKIERELEKAPILRNFIPANTAIIEKMVYEGETVDIFVGLPLDKKPYEPTAHLQVKTINENSSHLSIKHYSYKDGVSKFDHTKTQAKIDKDIRSLYFKRDSKEHKYWEEITNTMFDKTPVCPLPGDEARELAEKLASTATNGMTRPAFSRVVTTKKRLVQMLINNPDKKYYNKKAGKHLQIFFSDDAETNPFLCVDREYNQVDPMSPEQWNCKEWLIADEIPKYTPVMCWNGDKGPRTYKFYETNDEFSFENCELIPPEEVPSWMK